MTIIADNRRCILVFHSCFPGGSHDAKVFKALGLAKYPQEFFKQHEYLLGDSAYKLTPRMIVPFKQYGGSLPMAKKHFNTCLSKFHMQIEHTIGMLKA